MTTMQTAGKVLEEMSLPVAPPTGVWEQFCRLKASLPAIVKDAKNPHFGSSYASFNSIMNSIRPALEEFSADFIHYVRAGELTTVFLVGGQLVAQSSIELPKLDQPQKVGSCLTYFKRYNVVLILGLETEDDDDANAASPAPPQRQQQPRQTQRQAPPQQAERIDRIYACNRCGTTDHIKVHPTSKGDLAVWCKAEGCREDYGGYVCKVSEAVYDKDSGLWRKPSQDDLPF